MNENEYGVNRAAFIDSSRLETAPRFSKRVLRLVDLDAVGDWSPVGVLGGEVAIYADDPVDVRVGNGSRVFEAMTELRLTGSLGLVHIRPTAEWTGGGRVVVYQGSPSLGLSWARESYRDRQVLRAWAPALVWPLGVAAMSDSAAPLLSFAPYGGTNVPTEAFYLRQFSAVREFGTIDKVEYIETETGLSRTLWAYAEKQPTNSHLLYMAPEPVRLATAGYFNVRGSTELGDSALTFEVVYNRV